MQSLCRVSSITGEANSSAIRAQQLTQEGNGPDGAVVNLGLHDPSRNSNCLWSLANKGLSCHLTQYFNVKLNTYTFRVKFTDIILLL